LAELETVVERLERGELSLEENVALFERGVQLSTACKQQLSSAESRVQVLLQPESGGDDVRVEELALAVADGEDEDEEVDEDDEYEVEDDGRL
jgi:exodeoxyribonuclease VII small subunit